MRALSLDRTRYFKPKINRRDGPGMFPLAAFWANAWPCPLRTTTPRSNDGKLHGRHATDWTTCFGAGVRIHRSSGPHGAARSRNTLDQAAPADRQEHAAGRGSSDLE